ncbi:MAG: hypothetical protein IPN16_20620 [Gemmatimonadetes bacterium]|nr:hypothetical protein [Gemmatimonadota bacterium]
MLAACSGISTELPGRVREDALDNPALAATLVASAQGISECAFSEYVHTTGLWANELMNASGGAEVNGWGPASVRTRGTRTCATVSSTRGAYATYLPLQIARRQAETATAKLDAFTDAQVPGRSLLLATAVGYAGYSLTLLGEAYCQMALDSGPLVAAPAAVLTLAEERFTRAITLATAAGNAPLLNMARVGRARVRLGLGRKLDAAADARLVPANFVYNATYATSAFRRNNTVVLNNNVNFHVSVDPAYRGLTVGTTPDSRVRVTDAARRGNDALTPLWVQNKYAAAITPIPLATWDEAQLIIAEADGGQSAVDAINRIRSKYALPLYAGGTAAEIQCANHRGTATHALSRWSSHGRQAALRIAFPTGVNHKNVRYGDETCLPLPAAEMNGRT